MTSCQDREGRGGGGMSYLGYRAHGASCCALPRQQAANSSEKEGASRQLWADSSKDNIISDNSHGPWHTASRYLC